jgi:hypothetical protein
VHLLQYDTALPLCSRVKQTIEDLNTEEFISLAKDIFRLDGIVGLAGSISSMMCLILPLLWIGDLLGQNKLACLLSYACRRCLVRYHELGDIILQPDGSRRPDAPKARTTRMLRFAHAFLNQYRSGTFLEALCAHDYVRPSILNLGEGSLGIGVASTPEGVIGGIATDFMHLSSLGIEKMVLRCTPLLIIDSWGGESHANGIAAVRRFELRIADAPSFNDGVRSRSSFPEGFLLNSLLSAENIDDLIPLLVAGVGTDLLVFHLEDIKQDYFAMMDDFVYVLHVARELVIQLPTLEKMERLNFRYWHLY